MKIVVYAPDTERRRGLDESLRDMIRQAAGGHTVVFPNTQDEIVRDAAEAVVFHGFLSEEVFPFFRELRWIHSPSAGMGRQLYPALRNSDIILTNSAGIQAPYGAEHAFALLLGLSRGISHYTRNQIKHKWRIRRLVQIAGLTLGIIGLGGFGVQMAQRGKGFGMCIIAVDPYRTEKPDVVDELMPIEQLPDLMSRSDVVMIACPYTSETHHLINAESLKLMKPTAYLMNVTRGRIIDEAALVDALSHRRIAGAGLDVCEVEPLPDDSPLWDMENVIITPHSAGQSQHRPRLTTELFCDNLRRYLAGEPLENVVNKELGF